MNIAQLFEQQAHRTPGNLALAWDGGRMSYAALRERATDVARVLAGRGVASGDRVAILLPNGPEFAIALLAALRLGAVAAVLSPAWAPADAARALARADARLLVSTEALATAAGAATRDVVAIGDTIPHGAHHPLPVVDREDADAATILFSSGTTGDPKGVVLTHGNLAFNARSKIRYCGISATDRLAMVIPMAHCFGQNVVLLGALLAGAAVRIHDRFDAGAVCAGVASGEVTMLLAAPTAFQRLLELPDSAPLRRLRYALSAAAPLPAALAARWREVTGRALSQGYGLTECSPFATYDEVASGEAGRVGRAIEGVEVRIAEPEGDGWLGAGEPGEVVIRGPNVMQGYWGRPDATSRALRGGWLRTGDVGWLDADGTLHVHDRLDDVVNVAGFKAWPADVERALGAVPGVAEVAAYGVPDARRGAVVAAALVANPGVTLDLGAVRRAASGALAKFQRPAHLRVVDALPRSASGKVLRRLLAAAHHRDQDSPTNAERPATGIPAASR